MIFTEEERKAFENEQEIINELIVKYHKKVDEIPDLTKAFNAKRYAYLTQIYKALIKVENAYEDAIEL